MRVVPDDHPDRLRVVAFDYPDGRIGHLALVRESFAEHDAATLATAATSDVLPTAAALVESSEAEPVRTYPVPEGATFADGTPLKGVILSPTLSRFVREHIKPRFVHAHRHTAAAEYLFLCSPVGELTDAEANALITAAQTEPGFPVWNGDLHLWRVK